MIACTSLYDYVCLKFDNWDQSVLLTRITYTVGLHDITSKCVVNLCEVYILYYIIKRYAKERSTRNYM